MVHSMNMPVDELLLREVISSSSYFRTRYLDQHQFILELRNEIRALSNQVEQQNKILQSFSTSTHEQETRTSIDLIRMKECPPTPARNEDTNKTLHGLMSRDLTTTPNQTTVFLCYCKRKFPSYPKLKSHFIKKTQPKRLQCRKCLKRFYLGYQLNAHSKRVHDFVSYSCSMCYIQFETEGEYKSHRSSSLFDTDCSARLHEKKRKHEPFFTPLREGTYGLTSIRHAAEDYYDNGLDRIKVESD